MHCHKNASWRWCSNSSAPSGWSMDTTQSRGQGDFHAIKWRDLKRIWSKSANHGLAANPKTRPTNLASWNTRNQSSLPRTRLISCEEPPSSHKTLVTLPMDMQRLVAHLHVLSCSKCKMLIMIMMLAWFEMTCQHKTGLKLVFYKKKYQPSTRGHDRNEWEEIDGNEDYFIVSLSGVVQFSWNSWGYDGSAQVAHEAYRIAQAEPQMQSDQQQCIYRALLDFGYFINQAGENAPWLASEAMRVASEAASAAASRFWETATWAVRRWSLRCFSPLSPASC